MTTEPQTFELITLFGDAVQGFLGAGLMAKAIESGRLAVHCTDPRDFSHDRHRTVDDAPFGGGPGMVMKAEPVVDALEHVVAQRGPVHTILVTPSAPRFDQAAARRLAQQPRIAILCGRYEGIDDRVREGFVDECLSLGDFVLNGGELAALAIVEAVGRLAPGVLGNPASTALESFSATEVHEAEGLERPPLEHPQYTRPEVFRGREVPAVLRSGDHGRIERWRRQVGWLRTWRIRPALVPAALRGPVALGRVWVLVGGHVDEEVVSELVGLVKQVGGGGVLVWDRGASGHSGAEGHGHVLVRGSFGRVRRVLRKRGGGEPVFIAVAEPRAGLEARSGVLVEDGPELAVVVGAARSGTEGALGALVLDFSGGAGVPEAVWAADLAPHGAVPVGSPGVGDVEGLAIDTPMIDPSQPQSEGPAPTGQAETPASPRASTLVSRVSRAFAVLENKP